MSLIKTILNKKCKYTVTFWVSYSINVQPNYVFYICQLFLILIQNKSCFLNNLKYDLVAYIFIFLIWWSHIMTHSSGGGTQTMLYIIVERRLKLDPSHMNVHELRQWLIYNFLVRSLLSGALNLINNCLFLNIKKKKIW